MSNKKTLQERAAEMMAAQLPIMIDRKKGNLDDLLGVIVTIRDYGFNKNEAGEEYAVFIVDEEPGEFFFGGKVLTDRLQKFDDEGFHADILADGLPLVMAKKKTKDGKRNYTAVLFYPETGAAAAE